MCRTVMIGAFKPKIDIEKWNDIKSIYSEEIKERTAIALEAKKKENDFLKITVKYGNSHKLIKNFKTLKNGNQNKHRWVAYVRIDDRDIKQNQLIKSVEFELDESFPTSIVKRLSPPFEFQMTGWGIFDIPIKIIWQSWLNKEPTELEFPLSFEGNGKQRSFNIKIPKNDFAKNTKAQGKMTAIERLIRKRKGI
mmetsp:Transcript_19430/g.21730  ORF Transcript_19430/g.21730 Transcript_19430/m.21730 type:complete len:194 (+) Transcript_19430:127-708(+)